MRTNVFSNRVRQFRAMVFDSNSPSNRYNSGALFNRRRKTNSSGEINSRILSIISQVGIVAAAARIDGGIGTLMFIRAIGFKYIL